MSPVFRGGEGGHLLLTVDLSVSAFADGILEEVRAMTVQAFSFDLDKISLSVLGYN